MCQGIISHNSKVSIGTTIIKAKGGVIIRAIIIMDGGTI